MSEIKRTILTHVNPHLNKSKGYLGVVPFAYRLMREQSVLIPVVFILLVQIGSHKNDQHQKCSVEESLVLSTPCTKLHSIWICTRTKMKRPRRMLFFFQYSL